MGSQWLDRQTGIAGVFVTTVQSFGDQVVKKVYNDLEVAVYKSLSQ